MDKKLDLNEIRRQVYLIYSEDGLADLAVGLMIFGFGAFLALGYPYLIGLLGIIPFLVWYLGKLSLVIPRVGSIQPTQEVKKRFVGFFSTLLLLGAGVLALYLIARQSSSFFLSSLMIFGVVVGLGVSSLGLVLQANRFYLYGILIFAAMAVGEFLKGSISAVDPFLVAVISAGVVILLAGLVILFKFLNRYPVVKLEG